MVIDNKQTEAVISTEEDSSSVETKDGEAVKLKLSQLPLMNQVENLLSLISEDYEGRS